MSRSADRVRELVQRHHPYTSGELAFIAGWRRPGGAVRMMNNLLELERRRQVRKAGERMCIVSKQIMPTWESAESGDVL